ncbi:MAG TPA: SRPBCC domain-containing protein [Actinomycetota bacterium]|nr:SRPBCC domain-containing protein [Actinomycetota bacterium]
MSRTDSASLVIPAQPGEIFAAMTGRDALEQWLPPTGMTGRFEHFDARPGGSYRLVLSYDAVHGGSGKTTPGSDVVDVRFVAIEPDTRVVQAVDFESDDPRFTGTMTMTWVLQATEGGTRVEIRADDVPPGISAEDHAAGLTASLENLADYVAAVDT